MPTLVQNLESGPTVFADPPNNIALEWQGFGHEGGGDVQVVPDTLVTENTAFIRALRNGHFQIVQPSDEVQAKLDAQKDAYQKKRESERITQQQVIDRDEDKVLADVTVGEDGKVAQREDGDRPVAQRHKATAVTAETDERDSDGRPIEKELNVVLGPREQG